MTDIRPHGRIDQSDSLVGFFFDAGIRGADYEYGIDAREGPVDRGGIVVVTLHQVGSQVLMSLCWVRRLIPDKGPHRVAQFEQFSCHQAALLTGCTGDQYFL
jgi:hypothetical protein